MDSVLVGGRNCDGESETRLISISDGFSLLGEPKIRDSIEGKLGPKEDLDPNLYGAQSDGNASIRGSPTRDTES